LLSIQEQSVNSDPCVDGIILQAPALQIHNSRRLPKLVETLAQCIAFYFPQFPVLKSNGGKGSSLSVRQQVTALKQNDPLYYTGKVRLGTALQILKATEAVETISNMMCSSEDANLKCTHFQKIPLLLQHGLADQVCDIDGSRKFSQEDKRLQLYPDGGHDLLHEPIVVVKKVCVDCVEWLNEHC